MPMRLGFVALLAASLAVAAESPDKPVTFAKDIAPIFQAKCQDCHRKGSIAPRPGDAHFTSAKECS